MGRFQIKFKMIDILIQGKNPSLLIGKDDVEMFRSWVVEIPARKAELHQKLMSTSARLKV